MSDSPNRDYNRPNQLWQCGRTSDSCPCASGPTRWGRCRQSPRCTPRLSLRGRRGVFVMTCLFATVGLLFVVFQSSWRHTIIQPGPLSPAHADALMQVALDRRCATCHDAADADPIAWLLIASGNVASLSEGQATRCLKCHDQSLGSDWARFAHNVSPERLAKTTREISANSDLLSELLRVKLSAKGEVACSTCHREHHGSQVSLTELSDQQCQACHKQAFDSFEHGHPEFRHTLPTRRSRIVFDHVAHEQKHFPGKQQAFTCNQCHVDDVRRDVKRLAGFEQSCAQCHDKPIQAATLDGLVAFDFPVLDLARLSQAGLDVGGWPARAEGDFDGSISPVVRTLLMADDQAAAALAELGPQFDFSQAKSSDELRAVASLAWAYKRLLNDLAGDCEGTIRQRLEKVGGGRISRQQIDVVLRTLPPALFREARRRWLPQLAEELATRGSESSRTAAVVPRVYEQVRATPTNSELLIENPLAHLRMTKSPQGNVVAGSTVLSDPPPRQVTKPRTESVETAPKASRAEEIRQREAQMLVENPFRGGAKPPSDPNRSKQAVSPSTVADSKLPNPSDLAASGAWYLDDVTLSARYRSRGHADELLRLLVDAAATATPHQVPHQGLLPALLSDPALKNCASCHSIDTSGDHYAINWQTQYRDTSRRQFTQFSHRPHLVQPRLADCQHCHKLSAAGGVLSNYHSTDPMAHAHDFAPITKSTCVSCHASTASAQRCTLCHSYHVGALRP